MSKVRKYHVSCFNTVPILIITMISGCEVLDAEKFIRKFHLAREVAVLGITLCIFGLGIGALPLSPLSELSGLRLTFIYFLFLIIAWQCLIIWSTTIKGVFWSVFFRVISSVLLTIVGDAISDIFEKDEIGLPMTIYTLSVFFAQNWHFYTR